MSRTDLVADAFSIMRNAIRVHKEEAFLPYSNLLLKVCEILKEQGYIANFQKTETENFKKIKVYFKYEGKKSAITHLKRVSCPSRRIYKTKSEIPRVLRGYGLAIISTSKGIFTDSQAREAGLGGEVIGMVW